MLGLYKHHRIHETIKLRDEIKFFHNYLFNNYQIFDDEDKIEKEEILNELGNIVKILTIELDKFNEATINLADLDLAYTTYKGQYIQLFSEHKVMHEYAKYYGSLICGI